MSTAIWIRIGFVVIGGLLMLITFWSHAKKKITVNLAVVWEILGLAAVLVGAIPGLSRWCSLIGRGTAIIMFVIACIIICGSFRICVLIVSLMMKTQELAMQVSLLNQENEKIIKTLTELTGKDARDL